jgi:hypothetical protein
MPQKVLQRFATNIQSLENNILCHRVTSNKNIKNPDINTANNHNSSKQIFPDMTPMGHAPHTWRPDVSDVHTKAKR